MTIAKEEGPGSPIMEAAPATTLSAAPPMEADWDARQDFSPSADRPPRPASRAWLWVLLLVGGVLLVGVMGCVFLGIIAGYYLTPRLDEAKEAGDLTQTKTLTVACETYKLDNGDWPPNLEALTKPRPNGGPPIIDESALQPRSVPNGRFQYDPSGGRNRGLKPDIWVNGPHGVIGNWMTSVRQK